MTQNDSSYYNSSSSSGQISGFSVLNTSNSQDSSAEYWKLVAQHAANQNTNFGNNNGKGKIRPQQRTTPRKWIEAGPIPAGGLPTILTGSFFDCLQINTNQTCLQEANITSGKILNSSASDLFLMDPNISNYPVADISSPMITGNFTNSGVEGAQLFAIDESQPDLGIGEPLLTSTPDRRRLRVVTQNDSNRSADRIRRNPGGRSGGASGAVGSGGASTGSSPGRSGIPASGVTGGAIGVTFGASGSRSMQ